MPPDVMPIILLRNEILPLKCSPVLHHLSSQQSLALAENVNQAGLGSPHRKGQTGSSLKHGAGQTSSADPDIQEEDFVCRVSVCTMAELSRVSRGLLCMAKSQLHSSGECFTPRLTHSSRLDIHRSLSWRRTAPKTRQQRYVPMLAGALVSCACLSISGLARGWSPLRGVLM